MIKTKFIHETEGIIKVYGDIPEGEFDISTDSRTYAPGTIFLAFKGPTFDGFDYVEVPLNFGCKLVVFEQTPKSMKLVVGLHESYPDVCFIAVYSSLLFLQNLARQRIAEWKERGGVVVGVTGSNGKTTTKNMLFHIFSNVVEGKVHSTIGNFNNHIGVPLTILGLRDEHKYLIVEIGSSNFGEIEFLSKIVMPDFGIISNIGKAHLEFFHDEEGVLKEKRALFDYVVRHSRFDSPFVVNLEDTFLRKVISDNNGKKIITFDGEFAKKWEKINPYVENKYNIMNLVGCILLAKSVLNVEEKKLLEAATTFKFSGNRSNWVQVDECEVFLDAYNANPSSMSVAIEGFVAKCKKHDPALENTLLIIGDMNELGGRTEQYHNEIGHKLSELFVKNVFFVGRYAAFYQAGFGPGVIFKTTKDLVAERDKILKKYKYVFLKGSRTLQLESLIAKTI